jgi:hypothetical protein
LETSTSDTEKAGAIPAPIISNKQRITIALLGSLNMEYEKRQYKAPDQEAILKAATEAFLTLASAIAKLSAIFREISREQQVGEWWKSGESEPEYCHRPEKPEWEIDDNEPPNQSLSA